MISISRMGKEWVSNHWAVNAEDQKVSIRLLFINQTPAFQSSVIGWELNCRFESGGLSASCPDSPCMDAHIASANGAGLSMCRMCCDVSRAWAPGDFKVIAPTAWVCF